MHRSLITKVALLSAVSLVLVGLGTSPARAAADEYAGTVIHVKNGTERAMTFYVEFVTPDGQVRNFIKGKFLKPGETATFVTEAQWSVGTKQKNGGTYHLLRVKAVETERFDQNMTYWWGVLARDGKVIDKGTIVGMKCDESTSDDRDGIYKHLKITLNL